MKDGSVTGSTQEPSQEEARRLIMVARQAAQHCYAPYSCFPVGAALMVDSGEVITGANVENVSYGLTLCAERVAMVKALTEGHRHFRALAVWAEKMPQGAITPCGACRQVLLEFLDPKTSIYFTHPDTGDIQCLTVSDLMPAAFGAIHEGPFA